MYIRKLTYKAQYSLNDSTERSTTYQVYEKMEEFTLEYPMKNIPFPGKQQFILSPSKKCAVYLEDAVEGPLLSQPFGLKVGADSKGRGWHRKRHLLTAKYWTNLKKICPN